MDLAKQPPKVVKVGYCRFAPDLMSIVDTVVMASPNNNLYEKNWACWHDDDGLHWIYSTKPDHLILGDTQNFSTPNPFPWTGGVIRGGACPVLRREMVADDDSLQQVVVMEDQYTQPLLGYRIRDVYYHFFHGCLKRLQGSVYSVGCCVFEARPPYKILRQTPTPLLWPTKCNDGEQIVKSFVLWPGGAVAHAGAWHLSLGVDDTHCKITRIPFDVVERALRDVPGPDRTTSIRNTHIATGVTANDL